MKDSTVRITPFLLTLASAACGAPSKAAPELIDLPKGTATFHAEIREVRSTKGTVDCALFHTATGFPGPSPIRNGMKIQDATTGTMSCEYKELPAGDYAITAYHDENASGAIDTNIFGAPTEGYGASGNKLPAAAAPAFDDNKVTLKDGETVNVTINLKY